MTTTGWLDLTSGAAGDMLLAAYLDAGADREAVERALAALGLRLAEERVTRGGLAAHRALPVLPDGRSAEEAPGRHSAEEAPSQHSAEEAPGQHSAEEAVGAGARRWGELRRVLVEAPLEPAVRERALGVLERLVRTEAGVHGVAPDEVHLHEAGGLDALGDVVGVCAAHLSLGLDRLVGSTVALGGGEVRAAHGVLPVPVPAVVALLAAAGAPVRGGPVQRELCTPTGAALLGALVDAWGPLPPGRLLRAGVGAGGADLAGRVNAVRLLLLDAADPVAADPDAIALDTRTESPAVVLACNVDDLDPRLWPQVLQRLLDAGADDAWLTPILMKKGRPAHTLSVLCAPDRAAALRSVVVAETTSIGVREHVVAKHALPRRTQRVAVRGQEVRVKLSAREGVVVTAQPEWDDVAAAAAVLGLAARQVLAEAAAAASARWPVGSPWDPAGEAP